MKKRDYMFNQIKDFIYKNNREQQLPNLPEPLQVQELRSEDKVINNFRKFTENMKVHENFPQRGIKSLEEIIRIISEIDYDAIEFENQALIRKIIEKDIPEMVDIYLSLPKAHAVSFIIENGKTSKDTLLEKLIKIARQIDNIWQTAVIKKTEHLIKKNKNVSKHQEAKKDFFDM